MSSVFLSCLFFLLLVSGANGISCIVCTSTSSSSCTDPYSGGTSLSQSSSYVGCFKYVYTKTYGSYSSGYLGRGGYTSSGYCNAGTDSNGVTYYCCTDKDNCNGAMGNTASLFAALFLMIGSMLAKKMFFN